MNAACVAITSVSLHTHGAEIYNQLNALALYVRLVACSQGTSSCAQFLVKRYPIDNLMGVLNDNSSTSIQALWQVLHLRACNISGLINTAQLISNRHQGWKVKQEHPTA